MSKQDNIELQGTIAAATGGGRFSVLLENGSIIVARLGGKMQHFRIRIIAGDKVTVTVSPYDPTHGFITHRQNV